MSTKSLKWTSLSVRKIEAVLRLRDEGMSVREVANLSGVSRGSVYGILLDSAGYLAGARRREAGLPRYELRDSEIIREQAASRLPDKATETTPGSEDRILAMQARADRGESLFHPQDYQPQLS